MAQSPQVSKNNMVFKCTYHDGIGGFKNIGFYGTCTEQNIKKNIDEGRRWCTQPGNECFQYYKERGFIGEPPEFPCSEGGLFKSWSFDCGVYHKGKRNGEGIPVRNPEEKKDHIAFLTTRLPDTKESERKIFGYYRITDINQINGPKGFYKVCGDRDKFIILPLPKENWLNFWNYYQNKNGSKEWGSLLFRYVSNEQTAMILQSMFEVIRSPEERLIINSDIENYSQRLGGTLPQLNLNQRYTVDEIQIRNKYGSGGEGRAHKALKTFVFNNPESLGINPCEIKSRYVEFGFITGDRVDVAFELNNGFWVVIEIEIEGEMNNTVGMAQAVKYRSLMEVEKRFQPMHGVHAFLVAHSIPYSVRARCGQYNVAFKEITIQTIVKTVISKINDGRTS